MMTNRRHQRAFPRHLGQPVVNQSGQALVEFVLIFIILLVMVLGVIDFGRAIYTRQILVNVSREAANLASRGTPLQGAAAAEINSAAPLKMATNGRIILTSVTRDAGGSATINAQESAGALNKTSKVGTKTGADPPGTKVASVPTNLPAKGQTLFVAEVFYSFTPVTPVGKFVTWAFPTTLYDVSYF